MIELIVREWLLGFLDVPVLFEEPENTESDEYVVIEKTGSSEEDQIYTASFAIRSYAKSLQKAAELNHSVYKAMKRMIRHDLVTRVDRTTDYNDTDTERKQPRYQAVFEIVYYDNEED